jgi:hypothetical protein
MKIQKLLQEGEIQIFKIKKDSFLAKAVRFRKGARKILAGNNLATNQKKGRRPEMPWQIIGMRISLSVCPIFDSEYLYVFLCCWQKQSLTGSSVCKYVGKYESF